MKMVLAYRPPYHWEEMLIFLAERTIAGIEAVKNNKYMHLFDLRCDPTAVY